MENKIINFNDVHDQYEIFSMKKYTNLLAKPSATDLVIHHSFFNYINEDFDIFKFLPSKGFLLINKCIKNVQNYFYFYNFQRKCSFIVVEVTNLNIVQKEGELPIIPKEEQLNGKIAIDDSFYLLSEKDFHNEIFEEIKKHLKPDLIKKTINFLAKDGNHFRLNKIELEKEISLDFDLNYNEDFNYKKVQTLIDEKVNGLILLGGLAGSGKSFYIKYLIHNIDRPFLYVPNQYVDLLTSPDFINFAIEHLKNYVLILEDCENILISRDVVKTSAVPTILNLTDGIIGDILNLTIIGTYNTIDKIDTALFRKGRLLYQYHFDKLSSEKCNALSNNLGFNVEYKEPTTLAEVYNIEDNGFKKIQKTIGFK